MRVLAAAGDAGGGSALLPVIKSASFDFECQAYRASFRLWTEAGLTVSDLVPNAFGFDCILTGTSSDTEHRELKLIESATALGIPSVSVLDSWVHYRERYTMGNTLVLPTRIAVMDESAFCAMSAAGLPEDRIVITGQPAFDTLQLYARPDRAEKSRALVSSFHGLRSPVTVLFASQPLSEIFEPGTLGFHEREVLEDSLNCLNQIALANNASIDLIVKLHPREYERHGYSSLFDQSSWPALRISFSGAGAPHYRDYILAADLIIGMNSILLLEACYLGKPVISYQPGLKIADCLRSNWDSWSRLVRDRGSLHSAVDEELFDPEAKKRRLEILRSIELPANAAGNVVRLLESITNRGQRT